MQHHRAPANPAASTTATTNTTMTIEYLLNLPVNRLDRRAVNDQSQPET